MMEFRLHGDHGWNRYDDGDSTRGLAVGIVVAIVFWTLVAIAWRLL